MPINRITNLVNGNVVDAPELNSEFNNIVNALNSTNPIDIIIRQSSATLAPLTLNQQGTGPIARFLKNGSDAFIFSSGGELSIISDFTPHLRITRTSATARTVDVGIDGVDNFGLFIQSGPTAILTALSTGVTTFSAIPVGPAANPTTPNQLTRKDYVDNKTTAFSVNFFEADPSTATFSSEDRAKFICPEGNNIVPTKAFITFVGTHTGGSVLSYIFRRRNSAGGLIGDIATVTINDTNNTQNVVYFVDFVDFALNSGDTLTFYMATRTGTITERSITLGIIGLQRVSV